MHTLFAVTALAVVCLLLMASAQTASAVPVLQLGVPGGSYDTVTESWTTAADPFTLQVVGASHNGSVVQINDLRLVVAVYDAWWQAGGSVTVTGPGWESGVTLSDWTLGQPEGLAPHGVYPSRYAVLPLPGMDLETGTTPVTDLVSGEGNDEGVIYEYQISYAGLGGVHADLVGETLKKNGHVQQVFAPYSHDVNAFGGATDFGGGGDDPVAEPSVVLLLGMALMRLAARSRRA